MPALPNHPGVLRYKALWLVGTDNEVSTVFHYTYTGGPPSAADAAAIAANMYGVFAVHVIGALNAANSLRGVSVQDLTSPTSAFGEDLALLAGTRSGGELAAGTAVLANYSIVRRYRGGKPRSYWPWGSDTDLATPQTWNSGGLTAFGTAIDYIFSESTGFTSGTTVVGVPCSVSDYEGFTSVLNPITGRTRDVPKVRSVAIPPDVFGPVVINPNVASQRRRNRPG